MNCYLGVNFEKGLTIRNLVYSLRNDYYAPINCQTTHCDPNFKLIPAQYHALSTHFSCSTVCDNYAQAAHLLRPYRLIHAHTAYRINIEQGNSI